MKSLVVEDKEAIQALISAYLKKAGGFEIEFETDGNAAFERYCEHGPYDLVTTDFLHSGMDGLKLSKAIRKKNPKQVIVVFTASPSSSLMRSFQRLNIPVLLKLEANLQEFVRVVKEVVCSQRIQ
jgi:CheY-like chemotaxis protein